MTPIRVRTYSVMLTSKARSWRPKKPPRRKLGWEPDAVIKEMWQGVSMDAANGHVIDRIFGRWRRRILYTGKRPGSSIICSSTASPEPTPSRQRQSIPIPPCPTRCCALRPHLTYSEAAMVISPAAVSPRRTCLEELANVSAELFAALLKRPPRHQSAEAAVGGYLTPPSSRAVANFILRALPLRIVDEPLGPP
jgi:hypothetical protein